MARMDKGIISKAIILHMQSGSDIIFYNLYLILYLLIVGKKILYDVYNRLTIHVIKRINYRADVLRRKNEKHFNKLKR